MGVREIINRRSRLVVPVAGLALAVAIASVVYFWKTAHQPLGVPITRVFFSDDDGKTYFVDAVAKNYSFDHVGKAACRAYVYQCGQSTAPFVGYLARQLDDANPAHATSDVATRPTTTESDRPPSYEKLVEVKKPGDVTWVARDSLAGQAIQEVVCPDGQRPLSVLPADQ